MVEETKLTRLEELAKELMESNLRKDRQIAYLEDALFRMTNGYNCRIKEPTV